MNLSTILAGAFGFCAAEAGIQTSEGHYGWAVALALYALFFLAQMVRVDL